MKSSEAKNAGSFLPVYAEASPSLALVKYWGKAEGRGNVPATTSLAVTLEGLRTTTVLTVGARRDEVLLNGKSENPEKFETIFRNAREKTALPEAIAVRSANNFPTGAGVASSSSGFAALALGLLCLGRLGKGYRDFDGMGNRSSLLSNEDFRRSASRLACSGSVSASRAVYGGFTLLERKKSYAEQLAPASYWGSLRILVIVVSDNAKDVSSRDGMRRTEETSPYYRAWLNDSAKLSKEALAAFAMRDLEKLGVCMRASYMRMHASAMASSEPLIYWKPESLAVISLCSQLRQEGFGVWETMDAGPQVKLLYDASEEERLVSRLRILLEEQLGTASQKPKLIRTRPGGDPVLRAISYEEYTALECDGRFGKRFL